jgi:SNF2 family DNA or RNA helicase
MSAVRPQDSAQLRIALAGWLNGFDLSTRAMGRDYYARGLVGPLDITSGHPVTTVLAAVRGGEKYDGSLIHTAGKGWRGECSCPVGIECKHLYAVGSALLVQLSAETAFPFDEPAPPPPLPSAASKLSHFPRAPAPPPKPAVPPDEAALLAQFAAAHGAEPERKHLTFLRNLLSLHRSLRAGGPYFDFQSLQNLLPNTHRYGIFNYYNNPFAQRWSHPPSTALELWSHLALIFSESDIPLPEFMRKLTDLPWARNAIAAYHRERELAAWRTRFAALENSLPPPAADAPPPPLRTLRLRLARKKPVWEISSPDSPAAFLPLATTELRNLLESAEHAAFTLDPASASLAAILRARQHSAGRIAFKLTDPADREFLGRLLLHPLARTCVVDDAGRPITRDPRRLVWQFRDHPTDPELATAQFAFADGTPAPTPLLHLPGQPDLYLHGTSLFAGLPPPAAHATDVSVAIAVPRTALALPEATRFAARAGLSLPNDTSGRFRRETLRPRLRAQLSPRQPDTPGDDILLVELAALAPDGTPRAIYDEGTWRRTGPGLPPAAPDSAFLLLDFEPTRPAVENFLDLPSFNRAGHPDGPRYTAEITAATFPEIFADWLAGFPPDTLIDLAPELAAFAQAPTRAHFAIDLTPGDEPGIDWFDVRVTLRAEDTTLTPAEITLLHAARGRFVRLAGHGWRRLALDDSAATQEKIARLGLDPATAAAETGREPLRFHALQLADESLRDALPEKLWSQVCARSAALRAMPPPTLPAGLIADLRPYQHEGFHFLAWLSENNFGGVLADDMGLGKTLQTLAWLLWLAAEKTHGPTADVRNTNITPAPPRPVPTVSSRPTHLTAGEPAQPDVRITNIGPEPAAGGRARAFRALIICPKSVVVNWQLETARFAPALTTTAFTSALISPASPAASSQISNPKSEIPSQLSPLTTHLLIANYTQLRLNADAFASESWDAVILDEGQNIKNPASATAQAARALRTAHRLVLTGTPVENRLLDLWSLFSFAQPGLLGGQTAFKRLYNDKADPAGARARLAQRVKHFLLRRTKSQVARDLPPRIEKDLEVDLEGPQRALYDAELKRTRALLLGVKSHRDFDTQRFNILQSLLRLRQICCDPRLVGAGEPPQAPAAKSTTKPSAKSAPVSQRSSDRVPKAMRDPSPNSLPLPSAKLEALLDTLEPLLAEGHKVLIFSQFVTMLELIRTELTARGLAHLLLTGQTENRQALVDKFQTDPAIPIFLLSLKAAGSGLNLTAASYVVLFDPWWNPAVEAQAIDRTHRIGQKSQVIAYRLIARNTVEEKIRALQKEKAALAAAVVQEESLATVLDLDSLRQILA